jgi:hypothetical protein
MTELAFPVDFRCLDGFPLQGAYNTIASLALLI